MTNRTARDRHSAMNARPPNWHWTQFTWSRRRQHSKRYCYLLKTVDARPRPISLQLPSFMFVKRARWPGALMADTVLMPIYMSYAAHTHKRAPTNIEWHNTFGAAVWARETEMSSSTWLNGYCNRINAHLERALCFFGRMAGIRDVPAQWMCDFASIRLDPLRRVFRIDWFASGNAVASPISKTATTAAQ